QVSAEIETLKHRLHQRSLELSQLNSANESGQAENASLREKLEGLSSTNERERAQLEGKLSTVIHSQAGKLAVQHRAFVNLQARLQQQLGEYQKKCTLQQQEITHLRSTIETMERETGSRLGGDEVEEMQRAMMAWQAQATEAQQELRLAARQLEGVRGDGLRHRADRDRLVMELEAAEAREKALLGYWRQLQAALGLGTTTPMPADRVVAAVNRLQEEREKEASAKAKQEQALRARTDGIRECKDLEGQAEALARERETRQAELRGLEDDKKKAVEKLEKLREDRLETEAAIAREEARIRTTTTRLTMVEDAVGEALDAAGLRTKLDEASAARESALAEATAAKREVEALVSSRDEAVRASGTSRKKLEAFEGTLDRVSRETQAVLDEKEAELRRLQRALGRKDAVAKRVLSERKTEQQAHAKG
ncbi:unnamed protein product, partial [Ectocarpus sp. 12 AP-2014]